MEMLDENSSLILKKDPYKWSQSEIEHLCQRFMHYCDSEHAFIDRLLATRLWRYWFLIHKDQPLMPEARYNIALMFHAGAFGEYIPRPGDGDFFARYRQEHAAQEESPALPQLQWGPRATMNPISGPTLDSAVIHACVCRSEGQIHEILIAGQGLPEFRQEVLQTALSCMLQVQAADLDMLNVDAYRIVAPASNQDLFTLPGISTLGDASTLIPHDNLRATDALSEIVQKLRRLQEQTELVNVYECDAQQKQEFDASLRNNARAAYQLQGVTIVAKETETSPSLAGAIAFTPYYQIAQRPTPLKITLEPAVVQLPSFEQLLEAFTFGTVERISADAKVRQETYEERVVQLRMEQERWSEASERTRKEMWSESQLLSEVFNHETGTIIRLAEPENIPTSVYMEQNLPWLIKHFEQWAAQMRKIVTDIREAIMRPDTPIRRIAASRFLDAALRDRGHLIEDTATRRCFEKWSAQVAPLIRFKWRTTLQAKGIAVSTVFTRNTVFHTRFQVDERHNVIGLVMQPLIMVSPIHSLLIFDSEQPTLSVRNVYDHAEAYNVMYRPDADKLWDRLKNAVTENYVSPIGFSAQLRDALAEAPFELLPKLMKEIAGTAKEFPDSLFDIDQFNSQRAELIEKIRTIGFPNKINTLLNYRAFHSARELIHSISVPENFKVRLLLWQVLVECLAHSQDPSECIPLFASDQWRPFWEGTQAGAQEIAKLLNEAKSCDSGYVQEWIERLSHSNGLPQAIHFLRQDWVRLEDHISTLQQQILYDSLQVIESIVLAKETVKALNLINTNGESTATLLTKLGQPIEDLLLTDLGATPFSDVIALLEILVGRESPSH